MGEWHGPLLQYVSHAIHTSVTPEFSMACEKADGSEWARPLESESVWQQREMYELVDSGSALTFHNAYVYTDVREGGLKISFLHPLSELLFMSI